MILFIALRNQKRAVINPLSIAENITSVVKTESTTDQIANLLYDANIETSKITVASDSSILITLKTGEEIVFANDKSPKEQIASLQLIRARLTIEGKRFNRIDFRYDNPVITFY